MTYLEKTTYLTKNYKDKELEERVITKLFTKKQLEKAVNEGLVEKFSIRVANATTHWNWKQVTMYKVK